MKHKTIRSVIIMLWSVTGSHVDVDEESAQTAQGTYFTHI